MTNTSWSHGYYTKALYTCGFYREMAPNWLDFAALVKGQRPPRKEGEAFRYLELGSGMGLHLCLLAAAYPEGQFVGIDFHADHISNSLRTKRRLGLDNIAFVHADILDLGSTEKGSTGPSADRLEDRAFHYIACHGMYSWVEPSIQSAILSVTSRCLTIGGIFYLSYNTLPGWMPNSIFHHLAEGERRRSSSAQPLQAYQRATELLASLIGKQNDDQPTTPLADQQPMLRQVINEVSSIDPSYLLHEYANPNWQPVWVDEVHPRLLEYQLRFLGSANFPELFPELLPPFIKTAIEAEPESARKELCIDLALCRRFRRDIFFLGFDPLRPKIRSDILGRVTIRRLTSMVQKEIRFPTAYGEIAGDAAVFAAMDRCLQEGEATIADLAGACERQIDAMPVLLALALNSGLVALGRPACGMDAAKAVNRALLGATAQGEPFCFVVAPKIGSALALQLQEALLMHLLAEGTPSKELANGLLESLEGLDQQLQEVNKELGKDQETLARQAVQLFMSVRAPLLRGAGIDVPTS